MSNFKSGSGNLDFGGGDDEEEEESDTPQQAEETADSDGMTESTPVENSSSDTPTKSPSERDQSTAVSSPTQLSTREQSTSQSSAHEYPYFVRRNNVGDERDTRLELHVRDQVAAREAKFRSAVAEHLGTGDVSKTDAREFALLLAFEHPEKVAELMQDEGFGALD